MDKHDHLIQATFIVLLIVVWHAMMEMGILDPQLIPSPKGILASLIEWHESGGLYTAVYLSLRRVALAYLIALVLGVLVGILIGSSRLLDNTLGALVRLLHPIPGIAWIPLVVVWFSSLSEISKIYVIATGAIFPIIINTSIGVSHVPPIYAKKAKTFGAGTIKLLTTVILPSALPNIIAGLRIAWAFSWRALIAAEMILAYRPGPGMGGLGGLIELSREFADINLVGLVMIILATLSLTIDRLLFNPLENKIKHQRGLTITV